MFVVPIALMNSPTLGTCNSPPTILTGPFSPNVIVNGRPVALVPTTTIIPHKHHHSHTVHPGNLIAGAPRVRVNGLVIGTVLMPPANISCGDTVAEGSETVFVGL